MGNFVTKLKKARVVCLYSTDLLLDYLMIHHFVKILDLMITLILIKLYYFYCNDFTLLSNKVSNLVQICSIE